MKKKILFLWALLMGFFVPTHAQTWTWDGETPTAGNSYFIYTVNQNKFLNDNNGLDAYPTVLWTIGGTFSTNYTLTSVNSKQFAMYRSGSFLNYSYNVVTNATGRSGNDINLSGALTDGKYSIYRNNTTNWSGGRNVVSTSTGITRQSDASYEWYYITENQKSVYDTYFNAYQSAYNEVRSIYPDYAIPTDLKSAGFNDVVNKIGKLNELKNNYKGTFANPLTSIDSADPSVILADDGYYYLYSSEAYSGQGIPVWRSADMVNWTFLTTIFKNRPANVDYTFLWAPEVAKVGDKYVLYYANAAWGDQASTQICVATSDNPYGPFTNNKILVRAHDSNFGALNANVDNVIDPHLLVDGNNKYLIWGSWHGIHYIKLTDDGTSLAETTRHNLVNGRNDRWDELEAPMVFKKDNYFYLIGSYGNTLDQDGSNPYKMRIARGQTLGGAFQNKNNTNLNGSNTTDWLVSNDYVKNPGHCSKIITDDNGIDYIFYHGYAKKNGNWDFSSRVLFMSPVTYDSNGWPIVQAPTATTKFVMPSVTAPTVTYPEEYEISNADELLAFAEKVNNGQTWISAKLTNDINMSEKSWKTIGTIVSPFHSTIDGQNHTISNLKANINGDDVAFIGAVDGNTTIKNLVIDSSCSFSGNNQVAGFVGHAKGSGILNFINCGNEATIKATGANASGFLGYTSGISTYWTNCYNTGDINGGIESAAFSGWCGDKLTNCWNTGRTMGNDGDGNGKWLSLTRGDITQGYENTYDLNAANNSVTGMPDGYDPSWLANGHLAYVMNQNARETVWYQNVDDDLVKDKHPVFLNGHKVVNYDGFAYYNENRIAEYTRNVTSGNFGTICLPYASTSYEGAKFYNVAGTKHNANGELTALALEEVEGDLEAGKPYIFRATDSTLRVKYNLKDVCTESHPATYGLVGNLSTSVLYVPVYDYLISQNKFYRMIEEEQGSINQYRAYITLKDVEKYNPSSSSKAVIFGFDGTISEGVTTGINEIESNSSDVYYNVAGQRVGQHAKGLVIMNGKKYIRK